MPSCIYCGAEADSAEHWLPRSLGTFGPLQVLHGAVCGPCNEGVGEADREFIRTGPEGIHRRGLGIAGREREGGNPFYYRAATTQPVQARSIADPEEGHLYWETRPGEQAPEGQLMQQVVLENDTQRRSVPFSLEWNAQVLRGALDERGVQGWSLREVYCEPEHLDQARVLLRQVLPGLARWSYLMKRRNELSSKRDHQRWQAPLDARPVQAARATQRGHRIAHTTALVESAAPVRC